MYDGLILLVLFDVCLKMIALNATLEVIVCIKQKTLDFYTLFNKYKPI